MAASKRNAHPTAPNSKLTSRMAVFALARRSRQSQSRFETWSRRPRILRARGSLISLRLPCARLRILFFPALSRNVRLWSDRLASAERHLSIEHGSLDAFRLVIVPLIGRFDLVHHRLVHVSTGKQRGDRRESGENRSAQSHPRNPRSRLCSAL